MITGTAEEEEIELATKLLMQFGGEVDDFFKLWPRDKLYFFSNDKLSFLAYNVSHKTAVCLFDPVGSTESIPDLIRNFQRYCKAHGWTIAFIQTTDHYKGIFTRLKFQKLFIGSDAVIDVDHFNEFTVHNRYFRNLMNRIDQKHYTLTKSNPPHTAELIKRIKNVSDDWLKLPGHKEWHFLTGRFDEDYLQQVSIYLLTDTHGRLLAFANELPLFKSDIITVDLMRRRRDAPPNTIDFLFILLLADLRKQKIAFFNLGLSPLDGKKFVNSHIDKILNRAFKTFQSFIGFRGLHQFKAKYEPYWEPRYVWYNGSRLRLAQIGLAVAELMKDS